MIQISVLYLSLQMEFGNDELSPAPGFTKQPWDN